MSYITLLMVEICNTRHIYRKLYNEFRQCRYKKNQYEGMKTFNPVAEMYQLVVFKSTQSEIYVLASLFYFIDSQICI